MFCEQGNNRLHISGHEYGPRGENTQEEMLMYIIPSYELYIMDNVGSQNCKILHVLLGQIEILQQDAKAV